ncbi:MAG: ARMT1-like domain-containing protein [Desulfobacterales bacterium]|nr:ARMT1-like domain-containing protein [Desulfobacterales bacterium]MDH4010206.1 ARMT1-like domain-containing protein [Desulfobacterales bacterium]
MLLEADCVPCILRMAVAALRQLPLDENIIRELCTEILEIPALRGLDWNKTSAAVIEDIWRKIVKKIGSSDPFRLLKSNQNQKIMDLYPFFEKMVNEAADPLYLAVKLSILGNSMDLMVADPSLTVERSIADKVKLPLSDENYSKFRKQLQATQHLLIFGDNAGEIVFDKLLIETIKKIYQPEIAFVVRSVPTLNDATFDEAKTVGIDEIATVIENGIDGPLPGTVLKRCSSKVNDLVRQSDLIISKGGGNFDTLDEERKRLNKNISFLLLSKCEPYYRHFGVQIYQPILANYY